MGGINSNDFETKQIFFKSKDGVDIPLFVTHKKVCVIVRHDFQVCD